MKASSVVTGVVVVAALLGGVAYYQGIRSPDDVKAAVQHLHPGRAINATIAWFEGLWSPKAAVAQAPKQVGRIVPVVVTQAIKKKVPVQLHALGTVTPIASVAIKARLETSITQVHFADGANVKRGDLLFTLDSRQLQAQIAQVQAMLARDRAQLEGAERDVRRYSDLVAKGATPVTNLDNAKTQARVFAAAIKADEAQLQNLNVQLSYCTIRAPIDGRISAAAVKAGNFVRPADVAPLATINQIAPVYVSFTVSQNALPEVRMALAEEKGTVTVSIPGETRQAKGKVTMIDNTVDAATGMVVVRASMPNEDQMLWPGTLVTANLLLRVEDAIVVPSVATQTGQSGTYVFVIKNDVAEVRSVKIARNVNHDAVIETGLEPGELVVTDGQLLLGKGTKVRIRDRKAGA
jgi:RND family efflux transporter MFP subunit